MSSQAIIARIGLSTEVALDVCDTFPLSGIEFDACIVVPNHRMLYPVNSTSSNHRAICLSGDKLVYVPVSGLLVPNKDWPKSELASVLGFYLLQGDKIAIYANGRKSVCVVRISSPEARLAMAYPNEDDVKRLLELITGIKESAFVKTEPTEAVVKSVDTVAKPDVKTILAADAPTTNAPTSPNNYTITITVSQAKWYGIPCWLIPAALGGSLQIVFDRDVSNLKVVEIRRSDGHLSWRKNNASSPTNRMVIINARETSHFWLLTPPGDMVDAVIEKISA